MNHISIFANGRAGRAAAITNAVVVVLLPLGLYAAKAQAEPRHAAQTEDPAPIEALEDVPDDRSYLLSVRPLNIGLVGGGNVGFGMRLGAAGEYWLTDVFGVGLEGGVSGQFQFFGSSSDAALVGPTFGVRSAPRGGYFIATLGAGYASVTRRTGEGLCILQCAPPQITHYDGYSLSAAAGWLGHPGGFEIGPVVRLDAVGGGRSSIDYLVTMNFELGFAVGH